MAFTVPTPPCSSPTTKVSTTSPRNPDPALDQRLHRGERRGVARLHVGHPDPVDESIVVDPAQGVDRPSLGHRIGVEVAVEHEALAAAGPPPAADRVHPASLDG